MKCNKHPKYQAKFAPRCECEYCWAIWTLKNQPLTKEQLKLEIEKGLNGGISTRTVYQIWEEAERELVKDEEEEKPYHGLLHPKFRNTSRDDYKCLACGLGNNYTANNGTPFHVCPGGAGDPIDTFGGSDF